MNLSGQIAKHIREIHFGGNWTDSNLKDQLAGVNWQQATLEVYNLNTIAALTFHMNYYVSAILKVLQGGSLDARDKYSFDLPPIKSPDAWKELLIKTWNDAEALAGIVEKFPENRLWEDFVDPKYGTYYRNLHGCVEHLHYHLGQIAIIKKLLTGNRENTSP